MKNLLTIIAALLLSIPAFAATDAMNYQAVVYNTDGTPAANKTIGLSFAILNGDVQVYSETATAQSDANGLVRHAIKGIDGIDWSGSTYWLKVGIDPKGGSNYSILTQSEIMSVPTAAFAKKSGDSDELRNLIYDNEARTNALMIDMYSNYDKIDDSLKSLSNELEYSEEKTRHLINASLVDYATIPYVDSLIYELKDYIYNMDNGGVDKADLEKQLDLVKVWVMERLEDYVTREELKKAIADIKIEGGDTEALATDITNLKTHIDKIYGNVKDLESNLAHYQYDTDVLLDSLYKKVEDQDSRISALEIMITALWKEIDDLKNN